MIRFLLSFLRGPLGRVFDVIDAKIEGQHNRDRIKGEVLKEHVRHRADFMRAGGFWLMLLFALPLAFHFGAVAVYSVFWCAGCAFPQGWTIAALPPPLDQWGWVMITAIFGVVGLSRIK